MKSIIVSMIAAAGLMVATSTFAADMPEIAKKNGCTACHAIDKKVVGPAWADVAKKYKGAKEYTFGGASHPLVEGLMMKVSKGGSGNWGTVPMIANDPTGAKQADIKELVTFILGL
jgi:cytochrome c551/c552